MYWYYIFHPGVMEALMPQSKKEMFRWHLSS